MTDEETRVTAKVGHHLLVGALAVTAAVGASSAAAAENMFLKLADIKGESSDDKHKSEIDVLAWSWGLNGQSVDAKAKPVAACSELLSIGKNVDLSTTALATAATLNTTISTGKLVVRSLGENKLEFLVIDLTGITVKSMTSGGLSGDSKMTENLKLGFASAT